MSEQDWHILLMQLQAIAKHFDANNDLLKGRGDTLLQIIIPKK